VLHQSHTDDIAILARQTLDRWPADGGTIAANAMATLATAEYLTGQPQRAIDLARDALASLRDPTTAAVTLRRVIGQSARALESLVEADVGDAEHAVDTLTRASAESAATGSVISEIWARSAEGYVRLRLDTSAALPVIADALARSRAIGYPIGIAVNLRSLAFAHIAHEDWRAAVSALHELCDEISSRGAIADLGLLLDASAVLCHRLGDPMWEPLAATAASLPVVSLAASVGYPLYPLPATRSAAVPRRQALLTVRDVLAQIAADLDARGAPQPDRPATAASDAAMIERGDVWEIEYAARTVTVKASKGMADLAALLAAGGREVHCLDLVGGAVRESSTGDVIDAEARRSYEQRIRELQADVDTAEANNDYVRAERAQAELDTLIDHLSAALGQGGRARQSGDSAEKARSAVTQRVRSTIRRLERLHPELGRHLRASITTGFYCSYQPEHATTWRVG
jgi:hypothetical protein